MDSKTQTRSTRPGLFLSNNNQDIPHFTSNLLNQHKTIKHGFYGRKGGISQDIFADFNIAFGKGDDEHHVKTNRHLLCDQLGIQPCNLILQQQIHGNQVNEILHLPVDHHTLIGDALITNLPGVAIAVLTADCLPILMYAPDINYVAAIHAGRVGLLQNVIDHTVQRLIDKGAHANNMIAAIGPAIHQDCYQVRSEIYQRIAQNYPTYISYCKESSVKDYYNLDLVGIAVHKLMTLNINHIDILPLNTYQHPDQFFSCRYAHHHKQASFGNQISAIQLA